MSPIKYVVPALALAAGSLAASSCSTSSTTTIQNGGDAAALATCTTYTGSIAIATGTTDAIDFGQLKGIDGDLIAANVSGLSQISGGSLEEITGTFNLTDVQNIGSLNFPRLTTVDEISWNGLPNLQTLSFTTGIKKTTILNIQNTLLGSLDGINLMNADVVYLANNKFLNEITMQIKSITTGMVIEGNGPNITVGLPNLQTIRDVAFRDVGSLSIPSLSTVNGSFTYNTGYGTVLSAANLTSVNGSVTINSNKALQNISMPVLTRIIGALNIQNNTGFDQINGFPALTRVQGAVNVYGNVTDFELPDLTDVIGAFNFQSSGNIGQACQPFQSLKSKGKIQGKFVCVGQQIAPNGDANKISGTSSGSGSSPSKTHNAAPGSYVPSASTGFLGLLTVVFGLL